MTEHRCKDGTWREGKIVHCPLCRPKAPFKAKKRGES